MIVTGPAAINKSGTPAPADAPIRTPPQALGPDTPVILDSNVWIDLLVFADPVVQPIRAALDAAALHVVIDDACLRELSRVLLYPQFVRFAVDDAQALAQTRAWTHPFAVPADAPADAEALTDASADAGVTIPEAASTTDGAIAPPLPAAPSHTGAVNAPVLPRCSDRDDQKFLTLAAASGARWLVTKDKALLKLHRRMLRDFQCHVVVPAVFVAQALRTD